MAKGTRGRRRTSSRNFHSTPYPLQKKPTNILPKESYEDITCSVCMEYPHNAVLLLCSSHEKGCRPFMCGTSSRYSNCLDQYKKAYTKSENLLEEAAQLACPLCRGQVKGWTVVEPVREYLNCKTRMCANDACAFIGAYKDLKKHVKESHSLRPREVDPEQESKWRRFEREREREDVISTVTASMPGSVVFGDYVIERNLDSSESESEEEGNRNGNREVDVTGDDGLVNVFLLFHAFGAGNGGHFGGDGGGDVSLVNRLRREGRVLLSRNRNRNRNQEVEVDGGGNGNET